MTSQERADAIRRVVAVRAYAREHREHPDLRATLHRVAYQLYVVLLVGGLYGGVVLRTLGTPQLSTGIVPRGIAPVASAATTGLAVLLVVVGVRLGSWAGPVLLSRPDAAWLLPAPLDRRRLLRRDLGWGLTGYGVVGALVGAVVGAVVAAATSSGLPGPLPATVAGWGALGVVAGALALWVESSSRRARLALRGTAALVAGGALLVWLAAAAPDVAVWFPVFGWVAAPVVAASTPLPLAGVPTALLVLLAAGAVWWSHDRLPALPDEELVRRAGTSEGVRASAKVFDARAIAQARRSSQRHLVGHRTVRIGVPRSRRLLVPWRDLVSLLRRRGMLERTVVAVAAAAALVVWASGAAAALVLGVLVVAAAAGQLLEPLRVELEQPVLATLTPLVPEGVVLDHLAVPVLTLTLSGILTAAAAAVVGTLPWSSLPAACLGSLALAALLTTTAAFSSTRGSPPLHLLATGGDYGAILLVGWFLAGPLVALAVTMPLLLSTLNALQDSVPATAAVQGNATTALLLAVALALVTRWRAQRRLASG